MTSVLKRFVMKYVVKRTTALLSSIYARLRTVLRLVALAMLVVFPAEILFSSSAMAAPLTCSSIYADVNGGTQIYSINTTTAALTAAATLPVKSNVGIAVLPGATPTLYSDSLSPIHLNYTDGTTTGNNTTGTFSSTYGGGLGADASGRLFYIAKTGTVQHLWRFNTTTSAAVDVGAITPAVAGDTIWAKMSPGDMMTDANGRLYYFGSDYVLTGGLYTNYLYYVDANMVAHRLGSYTSTQVGIGVAFDPAGTIYTLNSNLLYKIDLTAGFTSTLIGNTGNSTLIDMASCALPTMNPSVSATKTLRDVTTSQNPATLVNTNDILEYSVTIANSGNLPSDDSKFIDAIPAGTSYVAGSTQRCNSTGLTCVAAADVAGAAPFLGAGMFVNTSGQGTGVVLAGATNATVVKFRVKVTSIGTPSSIVNTGQATYPTVSAGLPTTNTVNTTSTSVQVVPPVSIAGTVFEDVNYGGGAGRDFTTSGSNGRQNARVELYDATGAFKAFTTTDVSGNYQFDSSTVTGGLTAGNYSVRVVNSTVTSSRTGYVSTLVCVQTFRTNVSTGTAQPVTNKVGGEIPSEIDAPSNTTNLTLTTLNGVAGQEVQSIAPVTFGSTSITGINFGYNFDTIVNTKDSGQGSLRQFITNSNALTNTGLAQQGLTAGQETSIFMIPDGAAHPGLLAGLVNQVAGTGGNANAAVINLASNFSITDANTSLDATTQTINIGNSNSGTVGTGGTVGVDGLSLSTIPKPEVVLNFQAVPNNTNAILVSGANTVLKGFASYGYRSNNNLGTLLNAAIVIQSGVTNAGPATVTQLLGGTMADGSNPGVPTLTIGHTFQIAGAANISNNYLAYNADAISFENTNGTNVNFINNELAYNGPKDNNSSNVSGIYSDQMETVSGTKNITIRGNLVRNSSKPGFANAQGQGLQITYSTFITVENNTFSDNNVYGINAASSDSLIQKNIITGTKNTGLGQGIGVAIYYGNGTGLRNRISQNSIYQNAKLGIDHLVSGTTPGVNPNDGTVNAALANNGMDYPIVTSSTLSGGTLTVQGYVGNAAGGSATFANATLEFFLADDDGNNNGKVFSSDPGSVSQPHGEGKTYLGTLTTDGSGNFSGNLTVPAGVTLQVGDSLTATATDSVGNTSEFSANASVTVPVASNPELILVKRITAINTSPITTVIDPTTTPDPNDDAPNWPVAYLKGSIDTGIVKPGDELEYTIYFLSSGDTPITKVNICDLVPANSTFIPTTYNGLSPTDGGLPGADSGISLTIGSSSFYLSNAKDTDRGEFFLADTMPSGTCSGANDNGAVVVDIVTGANTLPNATAPGTPTNSYGLIRFRALVK